MNVPFILSTIPVGPSHGVCISYLMQFSRACGSNRDFHDRDVLLTRKLLIQGHLLAKVKSSLRKYYGQHHDMVNHYEMSVLQMITDML